MKTMKTPPICFLAASFLCATALLSHAEEDGLILSYDFARGENSGETIKDLSPESRDGTLEGSAQIVEEEGVKVLALDGTSGFVSVPGLADLQNKDGLTISAVVRFDDLGAAPGCADMILFKPNGFLFGRSPEGKLYFNIYSVAAADWENGPNSAIEMPTGQYVHVAATAERVDVGAGADFKGYRVLLWLNGQMVGQANMNQAEFPPRDESLNIGKGWGGPWFFKGRMKSLKVYDWAFTAPEIKAAAQANQ